MLIDDDEINNFINSKLLENLGIAETVKVCKNGKEGLEYILKSCQPNELICPEFIILDNQMPVMDGLEFLENLNESHFQNRQEVIILVLVANTRQEEIEHYKVLGVNEFSYKPLSKELIMEIYDKYWKKKQ